MCKKCGDYNYSFRTMKLDFTGRIAIVTGGRVKIGFYIVKKLLLSETCISYALLFFKISE